MDTANHVDFADRFIQPLPHLVLDILYTHFIGKRMVSFSTKSTKFTEICANIGIINMLIVDEKSLVTVFAFTNDIGQGPESKNVWMLIQLFSIFQG